MLFQRIKSEGLAHNSYFIASRSEAALVDPRRDCDVYVDVAQKEGVKIKYIFETHRNEDYVIGSAELSRLTGAEVLHGPRSDWGYGTRIENGREFEIGGLELRAVHTPGHTDESMSYVLREPSSGEVPVLVFTGDALFVGDVGRTDLNGEAEVPRMAGALYDSIFGAILPLGDGTILCPAHGAGSVCGLRIADRDESTLGIERQQNPALQVADREEFVKRKLAEKPETPPYFTQMHEWNLQGPPLLKNLPIPVPLTAREFKSEIEKGAVVVDTSSPTSFVAAHIKDSFSIWLGGLALFAGWFLPYDRPILLILEDQHELETAVRYLVRVGYDRVSGYLKGGIEGWYNMGFPTECMQVIDVHDLKAMIDRGEDMIVLDDRKDDEWNSGHIEGAMHVYVGHIPERMAEIPREKPVAMVCSTGRRAGMGGSILLREGFREVYNVLGSMTAWRAAGYPVSMED
ncbi:MAG: MBL fold metallo-hydrolase [Dehalococcoidia bacterium]|nr:MBL fold metallo-hydrolase [Dehalococcoidia bacterium]